MTKARKSGKVCPAGVGILLCQVGSRVGMVLCVYIESGLVSGSSAGLPPHTSPPPALTRALTHPRFSSLHPLGAAQPHLAMVGTADLSLISSQERWIQDLLEDDSQEQHVFSSLRSLASLLSHSFL